MFGFREWRRRRILRRATLPEAPWRRALALPQLHGLDAAERDRLRELCILFLHEKSVVGVGDLELDDDARITLAALACLPILHLGLDYYRGWYSVLVYPGGFVARHQFRDEHSEVIHEVEREQIGEAWEQGPVILSLEDIETCGELDGVNVVLHEFAHKLDMLVDGANGHPPLHRGMSDALWSRVWSEAYEDFCARVDGGEDPAIDPYAAESPGEFFAVFTEAFFELPGVLASEYPAVYEQLRLFYRQDPLSRLGGG